MKSLVAAFCPHCEHSFLVSEIDGFFLERKCPICGERIHEEAYDTLAAELLTNIPEETDEERWAVFNERISAIAMSRYLASEFHLLTGIPVSGLTLCQEPEAYSFAPSYDSEGKFRLNAEEGYDIVGGIEGELIVFDILRHAVSKEDSPLFGGKLVPGIALPWGMSRHGLEKGSMSQIDCTLLLPHCAFVIEVKRWKARITASHESMRITIKRGRESRRTTVRKGPLRQGIEHACSLAKSSPHLNTDWIGKVTVFVNPISFKSVAKRFPRDHNTFIGVCWPQGSSVVKAIEGRASLWSTRKKGLATMSLAPSLSLCSKDILNEIFP